MLVTLHRPSLLFPPSPDGQWACSSVLRWLAHHIKSLPRRLADDCSPVHHWLAHSDQSHPCQLASGCSACASLAGPSRSVPPSPAGRCGCSPVHHCWAMVTSPTLASWPMVARPVLRWLAHYTESLPRRLTDRSGCLYFTGWPMIPSPSLACQADG